MFYTLLILCLVAYLLWSWIKLLMDRKKSDFTGPMPLPVIGNGNLLMGDSVGFINFLGKMSSEHDGIALFYVLSQRQLAVSHPKFIEALVSSNVLLTKSYIYRFLHPWLGYGLLTSTGNRWKQHRKFLTPAFHFNILRSFIPIFTKNSKMLIENLGTLADDTSIDSIDLFPVIALATLDIVTESVMGVSFNAQKEKHSKYVKAVEDMGLVVGKRISDPIAASDFLFNFISEKRIHDEAIKVLHAESKKVISSRRQMLKEQNINKLDYDYNSTGLKNKFAFLDLLLLAEIDGNKIDDKSIREEVDTFMFEGHDTTSSAIVFALYCISKNPDVQEKILEEQRKILESDDKEPDFNDLSKMKYLDLVIKESLRLYPAVPFFGRTVEYDTELAGYRVLKDTAILIDVFHLQRRPDLYENPLEFRPERFEHTTRNPFDWIPFSAGPRNCIGQKFALLELKVIISAVVRNFKLFPSGIKPILCTEMVLRSQNGVRVKLKRRVNCD